MRPPSQFSRTTWPRCRPPRQTCRVQVWLPLAVPLLVIMIMHLVPGPGPSRSTSKAVPPLAAVHRAMPVGNANTNPGSDARTTRLDVKHDVTVSHLWSTSGNPTATGDHNHPSSSPGHGVFFDLPEYAALSAPAAARLRGPDRRWPDRALLFNYPYIDSHCEGLNHQLNALKCAMNEVRF